MLAAASQYYFSRRRRSSKIYQSLRTTAHVDFIRSTAEIAMSQKSQNKEKELQGSISMTDAKGRIAIYGSKQVVAAITSFFRNREALQVAAQAVEAELDGAEAPPVAAAIDPRAAGFDTIVRGDREMGAAAEIDAVGASSSSITIASARLALVSQRTAYATRSAGPADRTWKGAEFCNVNKLSKCGARYRRSAQRGFPVSIQT